MLVYEAFSCWYMRPLGMFQRPTSLVEYSILYLMPEKHCKQMAQGKERIMH